MFDAPVVPQESRSSSTEEGGFPVVPHYADFGSGDMDPSSDSPTLLPSMHNHDVSTEKRDPSGKWTADPNSAPKSDSDSAADSALGPELDDDDTDEDVQPTHDLSDNAKQDIAKKLDVFKDNGMSKEWVKTVIKQYYPDAPVGQVDSYIEDNYSGKSEPEAPVVPDDKMKPYYIKKKDKAALDKDIEDQIANGLTPEEVKEKIKEKWGDKYQEKSLGKHVDSHETVKSQKAEETGVATKTKIKGSDANAISDYISELTQKHHTDKWLLHKLNGKFGHLYPESLLSGALNATLADEDWDELVEGDDDEGADSSTEKVEEPDHAFYDYVKEETPESVDESVKTDSDPWTPEPEELEPEESESADPKAKTKYSPASFIGGLTLDEGKYFLDNIQMDHPELIGDKDGLADKLVDEAGIGMSKPEAVEMVDAFKSFYSQPPAPEKSAEEEKPAEPSKTPTVDAFPALKKLYDKASDVTDITNHLHTLSEKENQLVAVLNPLGNKSPHKDELSEDEKATIDSTGITWPEKASFLREMGWSDKDMLDVATQVWPTQKKATLVENLHLDLPHYTKNWKGIAAILKAYSGKKTQEAVVAELTDPKHGGISKAVAGMEAKYYLKLNPPDTTPKPAQSEWTLPEPSDLFEQFPQLGSQYQANKLHSYLFETGLTDKDTVGKIADYLGEDPSNHWKLWDEDNKASTPTALLGPEALATPAAPEEKAKPKSWVPTSETTYEGSLGKVQDYVKDHPEVTAKQLAEGVMQDKKPLDGMPSLKVPFLDDPKADFKTKTKFLKDMGVSKKDITDALKGQHPNSPWDSVEQAYDLKSLADDPAEPEPAKPAKSWDDQSSEEKWDSVADWAKDKSSSDVSNALFNPFSASTKGYELAKACGTSAPYLSNHLFTSQSTDQFLQHAKDMGVTDDDLVKGMTKYWAMPESDAKSMVEKAKSPDELGYDPKADSLAPGQTDETSGFMAAGGDSIMGALDDMDAKGKGYNAKLQTLMTSYDLTEAQAKAHLKYWHQNKAKPEAPEVEYDLSKSILPGLSPQTLKSWIDDKKKSGLSDADVIAKMKDQFTTKDGDEGLYQKQMDAHNALFGKPTPEIKEMYDVTPPTVDMTGKWSPEKGFGSVNMGEIYKHFDPEGKLPEGSAGYKKVWDYLLDSSSSGTMGELKKKFDEALGNPVEEEKAPAEEKASGWNLSALDNFNTEGGLNQASEWLKANPNATQDELLDAIIGTQGHIGDQMPSNSYVPNSTKAKFLNALGVSAQAIKDKAIAKHTNSDYDSISGSYQFDKLTDGAGATTEKPAASGWNLDVNKDNDFGNSFEGTLSYLTEHPDTSTDDLIKSVIEKTGHGGGGNGYSNMETKAQFLAALGVPVDQIKNFLYDKYGVDKGLNQTETVDKAFGLQNLKDKSKSKPSGWSVDKVTDPQFDNVVDYLKNHPDTTKQELLDGIMTKGGYGNTFKDMSYGDDENTYIGYKAKTKFLNELGITKSDIAEKAYANHPDASKIAVDDAYALDSLSETETPAGPAPKVNQGGDNPLDTDDLEKLADWAKTNKIGHGNLNKMLIDPDSFVGKGLTLNGVTEAQGLDYDKVYKGIGHMSDKDKAKWLVQHGSQNDQVFKEFAALHADKKFKNSELAKQLGLSQPADMPDPEVPDKELSYKGKGKAENFDHDYDNQGLEALDWYLNNGNTVDKAELAKAVLQPNKKMQGVPGKKTDALLDKIGQTHPTMYGNNIASYLGDTNFDDKTQFLFNHGLSKDEIKEAYDAYTSYNKPSDSFFDKLQKSKPMPGLDHSKLDSMIGDWDKNKHEALIHAVLDPEHELGHEALKHAPGDTDGAVSDMTTMTIGEKAQALIKGGVDTTDVWNAAAKMFPAAPTRALEATLDMKKPENGVEGWTAGPPEPTSDDAPVVPKDDGKVHSDVLDKVFNEYKGGHYDKDKLINTFVKPFGKNQWNDSGEKEYLQGLNDDNDDLPYDLDGFDQKKKMQYLKEQGFSDEDIWKGLTKSYVGAPTDHLEKTFGLKEPESLKVQTGDDTVYSDNPAFKVIQKHQKTDAKLSDEALTDLVLRPYSQDTTDSLKTVGKSSAAYGPALSAFREHLGDATHKEQVEFLKTHMGMTDSAIWDGIVKAHPDVSKTKLAKVYGVKPPKGADMSDPPAPTFDTEFAPKPPKGAEPFGPKEQWQSSTYGQDKDAAKLMRHMAGWVLEQSNYDENHPVVSGVYKAAFAPNDPSNDEFWKTNWPKMQAWSAKQPDPPSYSYPVQNYKDMSLEDFKSKLAQFPPESINSGLGNQVYLPQEKKVQTLMDLHPGMEKAYAKKFLGFGGYEPYVPEVDADNIPKTINIWAKHFKDQSPADQKKFVDYLFKPNSALSQKEDHPVQAVSGGAVDGQSISALRKALQYTDNQGLAKWLVKKGFDNDAVYTSYKKTVSKDTPAAKIENSIPVVAPKKQHQDNYEPTAQYDSPVNQYHPEKPNYGYSSDYGGFNEFAEPVVPDYHTIEPTETDEEKSLPHYGDSASTHFRNHYTKNRLKKPTSEESSAHQDYIGSGYGPINAALRSFYQNGQPLKGEAGKKAKAMNRMFAAYTTHHAYNVMRGTGNNHGAFPDDNLTGKTISMAGFTSTSFSQSTAINFKGGGKTVLLDIHVPKGMHVVPGTGGEQEMILPNMCQLYVQKEKKIKGTRCLKCVAIPPKAADAAKIARRKIALATLIREASSSQTPILV